MTFSLAVALMACGARQVGDGEDGDPWIGEPDWSPCAAKGEVETCAELCEASGMICVADGCPVDPQFCDPDPCDAATQALAIGAGQFCVDASVGTFVSSSCDAPIEWLFSNTLRCCCAQPE